MLSHAIYCSFPDILSVKDHPKLKDFFEFSHLNEKLGVNTKYCFFFSIFCINFCFKITPLLYAVLFNDIDSVKSILNDPNEDIDCTDPNGV